MRAGLLEQNTVDLLHELGVGERLAREGLDHTRHLPALRSDRAFHVDMLRLTGRTITIYGQQEVVKDQIAALLRARRAGPLRGRATSRCTTSTASVRAITYRRRRARARVRLHRRLRRLPRRLPAGDPRRRADRARVRLSVRWLGILAEAPPATDELIYAWHEHGFALHSMRSPTVSRLYLQVPDRRGPRRLARRPDLGRAATAAASAAVNRGADLRQGHHADALLRLPSRCSTAACSSPATPRTSSRRPAPRASTSRSTTCACSPPALRAHYERRRRRALDAYTDTALRRVWRAQDFSNYMTQLLHDLGERPVPAAPAARAARVPRRAPRPPREPGRELRRPAGRATDF